MLQFKTGNYLDVQKQISGNNKPQRGPSQLCPKFKVLNSKG